MNEKPLLDAPWPPDLDPATVPFNVRTVTVLQRRGLFDDWTRFNDLTEAAVLSWWNAGPVTIVDLRATGNEAIARHHKEADLLRNLEADLAAVAVEPWARHIWYGDPRFAEFVPKDEATVHDIATSGTALDRRMLWEHRTGLGDAVDAQAVLSLSEAVSQYVEVISGQHGRRLDVLLARTGLNGRDPITGIEAGRRLGVSYQRIHQLEQQLLRSRDRASPAAGVWMPQIDDAEQGGWPDSLTDSGIRAIRSLFR